MLILKMPGQFDSKNQDTQKVNLQEALGLTFLRPCALLPLNSILQLQGNFYITC